MDEFPGLLARDFGFRPQGKSAPMAASKGTGSLNSAGNLNVGIGPGGDSRSSSFSSNRSKSAWNSNSVGGSFLDDHDGLFGSTATRKTQGYGDGGYDDVFGAPPKYDNRTETRGGGASSASSFDYDSIFQGSKDSGAKISSLPVFDKPKYDDDDGDIFHGLPGMKGSSAAVSNDDVFASIASPPKQSAPFDDLLGSFRRKEPDSKSSSGRRSEEVVNDASDFDDLIPGFGGSSPPKNRATSETNQPQQSTTVPSTKSTASMIDDPFVVLESTSSSAYPPAGLFTDPLEQMSKPSNPGSAKFEGLTRSGMVLDDMDPLDSLGKSVPMFSPEMSNRGREKSPLRTGSTDASAGKESIGKSSVRASEDTSQFKVPVDNYRESHQTLFDIPSVSSNSNKPAGHTGSRPSFVNADSNETSSEVDMSPKSEKNWEGADDIWLTVSEIPLFTQPTSAPPPSRPPPRPAQVLKGDKGSFAPVNTKKVNEYPTFPHSTQNFQSPRTVPDSAKSSGVSSIDELEDFAMGRSRSNADERADILSSEEDIETNSAAAAMKEAMDRAEAKFKHAREVRERETARAARSREAVQQDAQEWELRQNQERLDREREREEKEREQRRIERERERAREIEMEKARQAVERATREARERAAAEARLKAERAQAEARERSERAAVQRAQAEARGRAAIDARERAERAAAEAREKAAAAAREKEARERAAVARAEAEVRLRAERAAVERAAAEARERAASEAKERAAAAAAARENQQKNGNDDLESFFGNMGPRPTSAPRPRPNTSDPFGSEGRRTSSGTSTSMKKASSTTNIVDDLNLIFGGTSSPSKDFQEIDGESEERRKARWDRQQRTQERAAKALAEKNERDLQTQRDQAERHRIAETLDIEIKRWAAGKEGNLRALLSTLQYVLWPECGWQPVSLTDLITGASVKKVYRKATLCIHPDKVQQKGANLQQKYIAEKVFDLLKEAWNKFNSEELF
ncbi:auxilin-related protein 2-like [Macadamia integrifolia]|uniref:auxilin-related protein 2-like n=1 Tax=Macadamia integrifolia TaxID=60698 RepID=UPI001C4E5653|nr:auxilin-related protein 2-like [Macadamia integrifolia]